MKLPKRHRAQLRWMLPKHPNDLAHMSPKKALEPDMPYYLLPATPEAYEAHLSAAAQALARGVAEKDNQPEWKDNQLRYLFVDQAKRMLAALGITKPKKGT